MSTEQDGQMSAPGVTWPEPKRACCICKREKIRCEGGRPCLACTKKGLRPEQCIDGCQSCRRARLICDGGQPCSRCQEANQECLLNVKDTSASPAPTFAVAELTEESKSMPILQPTERTKIACQACRRDNKRCDNTRPCTRCLQRKEDCVSLEKVQTIVKKRCQACRANNGKCEDQRPCTRCAEGGIECVDVERRGTGPGSRVKKACTHCRRLKVQCEDERPCKNCVKRGFDCAIPENISPSDAQFQDGLNAHGILAEFGLPDGHPDGYQQGHPDGLPGELHGVGPAMPFNMPGASTHPGMQQRNFSSRSMGPSATMIGPQGQGQILPLEPGLSSSTQLSHGPNPFASSLVESSGLYSVGTQTTEQPHTGSIWPMTMPPEFPPNAAFPTPAFQSGLQTDWPPASSSSSSSVNLPQGHYSHFYDSPADEHNEDF